MQNLTPNDKLLLIQYAINKYDSEAILKEKLKEILQPKDIERSIDTLIGTQKVRRIGADMLQNNTSHTGELPEIPSHLKTIVDSM